MELKLVVRIDQESVFAGVVGYQINLRRLKSRFGAFLAKNFLNIKDSKLLLINAFIISGLVEVFSIIPDMIPLASPDNKPIIKNSR